MRVRQVVLLLLVAGCAARDQERRSLRAALAPDSSRSSAEATLGADAPPPAVSSSVASGDASAQQDVLEYLGRHLYQSWQPDSVESAQSDEACRSDPWLQDGIELQAAQGIVRARLLRLTTDTEVGETHAIVEALRIVSISFDTTGGTMSSSRDMVMIGPVVDTMAIGFVRRSNGQWINCGYAAMRSSSPDSYDTPIALTGPPRDTLRPRGLPVRHMYPARTGWSRVQTLADSLGGQSGQAVLQKRVWAGAYVEPSEVTELPEAVRNRLTQMNCLIPLAFRGDDRAPLVVRGALYQPGRPDDWAVACSRTSNAVRASVLYVLGAARGFAPDSVYAFGRDVVRDDRRNDGRVVSAHEMLFNMNPPGNAATLGESVTAEDRKSLELTESEARQPLHDGLNLNLDAYYRVYWTGARWITIYLQD